MNNIESVVLFLLDQTSKNAKRFSQKALDAQGMNITVDQWVLLKIIHENDGLSQIALGEISKRDNASVTRTLDILEQKNLIQRNGIPENRRQYRLSLSAAGKSFVLENMPLIIEQRQKSLEGFSKKEVETLKSYLLRIQKNMT